MCARYDDLHASAELRRERNTVEVLTVGTLVQRADVEQDDEQDEQRDREAHTHRAADDLTSAAQVRHVRPHREREQKPEDEPGEMGVVVDPRK